MDVTCRDSGHDEDKFGYGIRVRPRCIEDADALVIITEWNEFRYLDWERMKTLLRFPTVIDLRNIYEPERMRARGFNYHSVGRYYEQSA